MKIRIELSTGRIIEREVKDWIPWGDGIRAFDENESAIVIVSGRHLVAFEVLDPEEEKSSEV